MQLGHQLFLLFAAFVAQLFSGATTSVLPSALGPAQIDIAISAPSFLIQVPFSVASGPSVVTGFVSIYFKATRSVKYITDGVGQFYLAKISTTTFLFVFQYQSTQLGGAQFVRDVLYLDRVSAEIVSLQVSARLAIGA
ncbi:hypothetical protein GGI20_004328 [Coemansia sp. BCRC 34301]|nr:hypothetical protein GGI20_004328 [Coemansia sp. BCRC 34301]